ncbi:hypothetical protein ACLOAV_001589 [Pseudogymnoascus australis]
MPNYRHFGREEYDNAQVNRLPSGIFFTVARAEHMEPPPNIPNDDIKQKEVIDHEVNYENFVVPQYNSTKTGKEIYLPLLEVSIEVDVVATIAWSKLIQTFTNRSKQPIKEARYCMPLYDKSTVTSFVCTIGSDKILKGAVKPKEKAKAEFKEAVARQQVAALLEEHTPEVFETTVGNIPAETTVKVKISYITELKADLGGDGILVTVPTSVAPRYGAVPSSMTGVDAAKSLAVPPENGLQIKIQVSSPVAITKIESRTHPVSIEMGSHGTRVTRDIRYFSKKQEPQDFDPKKAGATLSDRKACLGKDFVLLIQAKDGQLLASRAIIEPHPKILDRSALMVSINLRDLYTPNVVAPKTSSEIVFVADRSGSMHGIMEALKTAMKFFLKSLPNNCIFNICSFGSRHELMWPKSQPYNQENVDAALTYVASHFSADMGGTEILAALRHVVERSELSVNTEIITLTDGEVWDADRLFDFIQNTRSSGPNQNTRFFCLGIGEDVSHHLVAGIGRYGGGLAEVVPTDSTGDWMQRVIGMLRAALTPSSWTVDIILEGVSISEKESEDQRCIQAPYQIPDFHAFSRSSIYFLLSQEFKEKVIKVKATSISTGETFTTELPIEKSDVGQKWVHPLAAKAVLGDLESGRSWLHDRSKNSTYSKTRAEVDELAKIEGENIGVEWNISSKWTSFIVVDEKSLLEKQSRWYQAGHSDLAELTRPRFEPRCGHHTQWNDDPLAISGEVVQDINNVYNNGPNNTYLQMVPHYGLNEAQNLFRASQARDVLKFPIAIQRMISEMEQECRPIFDEYQGYESSDLVPMSFDANDGAFIAVGTNHIIPPSDSGRVTRGYPSTRGGSSVASGPGSGSGSGSHSRSRSHSPDQQRIESLTRSDLLTTQHSLGYFDLTRELRIRLNKKYKESTRMTVDPILSIDSREWLHKRSNVLDTAMVVVYIEEVCAADKKLWNLVVQKARAWLEGEILDEGVRTSAFARLKGLLYDERADAGGDEMESISPTEARPINFEEVNEGQRNEALV